MAVYIEMEGYTISTSTGSILAESKREPPQIALRGITGSFASSDEPFD